MPGIELPHLSGYSFVGRKETGTSKGSLMYVNDIPSSFIVSDWVSAERLPKFFALRGMFTAKSAPLLILDR